jgi:hypothetical protein
LCFLSCFVSQMFWLPGQHHPFCSEFVRSHAWLLQLCVRSSHLE